MNLESLSRKFNRKRYYAALSVLSVLIMVFGLTFSFFDYNGLSADASTNSIANQKVRRYQFPDSQASSYNITFDAVFDGSGNQINALNAAYNRGAGDEGGVEKRDPNGNLLWTQQCSVPVADGFTDCYASSVEVDAAGNIYALVDFRKGPVTMAGLTSPAGEDIGVALFKLDPNGNGLAVERFGAETLGAWAITDINPGDVDLNNTGDGIVVTIKGTRGTSINYGGSTIYTGDAGLNSSSGSQNILLVSQINTSNLALTASSVLEISGSPSNGFRYNGGNFGFNMTDIDEAGNTIIVALAGSAGSATVNGSNAFTSTGGFYAISLSPTGVFNWATPVGPSTLDNTMKPAVVSSDHVLVFTDTALTKLNLSTGAVVSSIPFDQNYGVLTKVQDGVAAFMYSAYDTSTFGGITVDAGDSNINQTGIVYGFVDEDLNVTDLEVIIVDGGEAFENAITQKNSGSAQFITSIQSYDDQNPAEYTIDGTTYNPIGFNTDVLYLDFAVGGRILDCRLPSDPNDPQSELVNVAPIIEPYYITTGEDQFGLALLSNGNIVTLDSSFRNSYGGGGPTGQSNTNIDLYSADPIVFKVIEPADPINSPNTPGLSTDFGVDFNVGRTMDIETRSFNGTDVVYIYALQLTDPNTTELFVDSDLTGAVKGIIYSRNMSTGAVAIVADNLPAAGYAKDFADMSIDAAGNIYIDDVRVAFDPTNDYNNIPKVDGSGVLTNQFAQPATNTYYDIASDDAGNAYSLIGSTDPLIREKNGVYKIDSAGAVTDMGLSFPVTSDGGDLEIADADDTYDTDLTGTDYIYYTSGFGNDVDAALVRISNDGSLITKSNSMSVDANFTSANTGYMDKVVFDYANQIIYYKHGARTENNPDETIGKIYCPVTEAQSTTPPVNPPSQPPVTNPPSTPPTTAPPGTPGTPGCTTDCGTTSGPCTVNCGGTTTTGGGDPDLTLGKATSATGDVNTGDTVTYTLTLTNNGTAAATGVNVGDFIDADVTFSGVQSCTGDSTACTFDSGTRLLSWSGLTVSAGTTATLNFGVVVN